MPEVLLGIQIALTLAVAAMAAMLLRRRATVDPASFERIERAVRDEFAADRREAAESAQRLREELLRQLRELSTLQKAQLDAIAEQTARHSQLAREEAATNFKAFNESHQKTADRLRETVEKQLTLLQQDNAAKLEEMRKTVDEKLQGTLERRLAESFKHVSERLEQVHKGLGEMQSLAGTLGGSLGDLKKVMTNVKTRGTWGEIQLGALLEQVLAPEQFAANVATRPDSGERVEYAIRLPGPDDDGGSCIWLPIDAKFPQEDYHRLIEAQDAADAAGVDAAGRQLEQSIRKSARDICEKYVQPPHTTDFAILFLPTEGLYAEVIRRAGLMESLQRDFRVTVAGPTTLLAMLNSLQMGFRTLAIQKRSSEVWEVLGAVKAEFGKFGTVLAHVKKKLQEAGNVVEKAEVRTRAMGRKLRGVEEMAGDEANVVLELPEAVDVDAGESQED